MPTWLDIIILSIVEGITEFLPVSSTGHMIITNHLLNIKSSPELEAFLVIVQSGAILAVISVFWQTFLNWFKSWFKLIIQRKWAAGEDTFFRMQSLLIVISVIPIGILGLLLKKFIPLDSVRIVAFALIVGAIFILITDFLLKKRQIRERELKSFDFFDALIVGFGQCFALWPGFSRSAATLIFARFCKFNQSSSAEIAFLIGTPTLLAAASYESIKAWEYLNTDWLIYLGVGILISWITAYVFVKFFISFLKKYSLNIFAYYRIILGIILLVFF